MPPSRSPFRAAPAATLALAVLAVAPGAVRAEPMDLGNGAARWVTVRVELSPAEHPAQTDTSYSPALPAWLEPGLREGEVRVTVAGSLVERHLMPGQDVVPGSFSDFVWVFDSATGHVRSATVSGIVRQTIQVGLGTWTVELPIRVAMDTERRAGVEAPRRLFGRELHRFCRPARSRSCREVLPRPYDASTGYVNALGPVSADSRLVRIHSFSPLGEAVFSEAEPRLADGDPTPTSHAAALN
jgi:hypothetical protein